MNSLRLILLASTSVLGDKGFGAGPSGGLGSYSGGAGGAFGGGPGGAFGDAGGFGAGGEGGEGGSLEETIPGTPGEDYPIYAEVPETAFVCDGQVDGGYYGDPEAECQAFHICASDGNGGLTKYSFLCPNGTLFQQQYFVCDWWFNVDCSTTEDFYGLNDEIAAEREANSPQGDQGQYAGGAGGAGGRGGAGARGGPSGAAQYAGAGGRPKASGKKSSKGGSRAAASSPRGSYAAPSGSSSGYSAPASGYQGAGGDSFGAGSGYGSPGDFGAGGADSSYGAPGGLGGYSNRRNARGATIVSRSLGLPIEEVLPVHEAEVEVVEE